MPKRVVKSPDIRRLEIMKAAEYLFSRDGYLKTTVENIIKRAGIAKGTFYYYFKAKQDILQALVEYQGLEMEALFSLILEQKNLTALEKLRQMLRGPAKEAKTKTAVMKLIHKPENRELQEKLNIFSIKKIAPLLAAVFKQGYQEGAFEKQVSEESVQLLLASSQFILNSGLFNWSSKKQIVLLQALQYHAELLTGTKKGTLRFISETKE